MFTVDIKQQHKNNNNSWDNKAHDKIYTSPAKFKKNVSSKLYHTTSSETGGQTLYIQIYNLDLS